jgi:hypothetical protein
LLPSLLEDTRDFGASKDASISSALAGRCQFFGLSWSLFLVLPPVTAFAGQPANFITFAARLTACLAAL